MNGCQFLLFAFASTFDTGDILRTSFALIILVSGFGAQSPQPGHFSQRYLMSEYLLGVGTRSPLPKSLPVKIDI